MTTAGTTQIDGHYARAREAAPPAFSSIVCGIDGSPAGQEAARQAAVLAGPGRSVTYVCVSYGKGVGPTAMTTITQARAERALAEALDAAREAGAAGTAELVQGRNDLHELLLRAEGADLVVVGCHSRSRAGGVMLGSVASGLAHKAPVPVLVARRPDPEAPFPSRVLVATDGSDGSAAATRLAAGIARRHGSSVLQVHVDGGGEGRRHRMAVEAAELMRAAGSEPVIRTESGDPHERIVEEARAAPASLVVVGSRGVRGVRALGSVSERVVHEAPCSVLVARPGP